MQQNLSKTWKLYNNSRHDRRESHKSYYSMKYCPDDNIELVRITLKKEKDRKYKL